MKRTRTGVYVMMLLGFCVIKGIPVWAGETQAYGWDDKLQRGVLNLLTAVVEVPLRIHNTTEEKNLVLGWTVGLVQGMAEGLIRFGAGAVDVLTCPFNFPEANKGPLVEPEFVWEKPGPKYL